MSEKLTSVDLMFLATSILRSNNSTKDQLHIAKKLFKELCEEEVNNLNTEPTKKTRQEVLDRIRLEEEKIKMLGAQIAIPSGSVTFAGAPFDINLTNPGNFYSTGSFSYEDDSYQTYPKNWIRSTVPTPRVRPPVPMPRFVRKQRG